MTNPKKDSGKKLTRSLLLLIGGSIKRKKKKFLIAHQHSNGIATKGKNIQFHA